MTMLAVQSFLLILAAFFAGAMIACFIRRVFFSRENESPRPSGSNNDRQESETEVRTAVTPEPAPVSTAQTSRFGRALTGSGATDDSAGASQAATSPTPAAVALREPQPPTASQMANDNEHVAGTGAQTTTFVPVPPKPDRRHSPATVLVQPYPAEPELTQAAQQPEHVPPPATSQETSATAVASAAAATAVAATAATAVVTQRSAESGTDHAETDASPSARTPATSTTRIPDNLTLIRAIDDETASRLNSAGVSTFADIAAWTASDVGRVNQALGLLGRINKENWIEQAATLSKGGRTEYATAKLESEADTEIAPLSSGGGHDSPAPSPGIGTPVATAPSAPRDPGAAQAPDVAMLRSVRSEALRGGKGDDNVLAMPAAASDRTGDDLKRIRGIGVLIEKKLNAMGVRSYAQIANWTAGDVARVSDILDFKGRIERESWIEQARILTSGGHTEFSRRSS